MNRFGNYLEIVVERQGSEWCRIRKWEMATQIVPMEHMENGTTFSSAENII